MKVLMINGSPKADACIGTALKIASAVLKEQGIESETVHIGNKDIRGCIACLSCRKTGNVSSMTLSMKHIRNWKRRMP